MHKPPLDYLLHYGTKRHSGRYPWGSGDDPYQHVVNFFSDYEKLKAKGLRQTEIAKQLDMNTTQLRDTIRWANAERESHNMPRAHSLYAEGKSKVEIGKILGVSEATVRNYLKKPTDSQKTTKQQLDNISKAIKSGVDKTGYLDVGVGVERQLGIARTKFNSVVNKLAEDEDYYIHKVNITRLSDPTGTKKTTVKVLTKDPDPKNTYRNSAKIRPLDTWSEDSALSLNKHYAPHMLDMKRIHIRYAEDGGDQKDGLIELRPNVKDLDLGRSKYAQVRIGAGENSYLKGMAAYSYDKFPDGVDIIFNTNKTKDTPPEKVLKNLKMTKEAANGDPSFMFGSSVLRQKGALNIVNEEGDWDTWSTKMSSQFLSKQPVSLIKDRLDDTYSGITNEFDRISSLTNPVVKKFLLDSESTGFINSLQSKARKLKADGLARTKSHVLLPFPDMNANEIYAPNYNNGERVVLVRHPHGGIFEIPELVVNNKNETARKVLGIKAPDAVGIHPSVASKLSGADFDGDTALVIPNNQGQIKTARSLTELKNFDPIAEYKVGPDHPANIHRKDRKTGEIVNLGKTILENTKQIEMGKVSNLITDMTIKGAPDSDIARAVRHSMVVIDAEKHNLDYKKSAIDNGYAALRKKYQQNINPDTGKQTISASTLVSRSKKKVDITDPNFDPYKYSSGRVREDLYAAHITRIQQTRNEAIKLSQSIKKPQYSKEAAKIYSSEVASLDAKLNLALLNAPKERQAQILSNKLYYSNLYKGIDKDGMRKLKARSLLKARETVGANKTEVRIAITAKEWEAIQARAISNDKLEKILDNADMDIVRKLATPRELKLSTAKASRARLMLEKGYTYAEVSQALGVSVSTIREEIKDE